MQLLPPSSASPRPPRALQCLAAWALFAASLSTASPEDPNEQEADSFPDFAGAGATVYSRNRAAYAELRSDLRVIVRFVGVVANSVSRTREQAELLKARDGVRSVRALPFVGMAVASCASQEVLESLVVDLSMDSFVELAVPDSLMYADGTSAGHGLEEAARRAGEAPSAAAATAASPNRSWTWSWMRSRSRSRRWRAEADEEEEGKSRRLSRLPNDLYFGQEWALNNAADHDMDAPEAWDLFTGETSKGIVVAVIDTGVDYTHEDLKERMWSNSREVPGNGVDDDENGYTDDVHGVNFVSGSGDPMDDNRHGTHCAGIIAAAGNNGVGITGIAWGGIQIMALKFLTSAGAGRTSDGVTAIDYAVAHGASILSASFGGGSSSSAMRVAIERAEAAGSLFVTAAGNTAKDNDRRPHYPSNYPLSNVVSVAATEISGALAPYSNWGKKTVHVAAPGTNIVSSVIGNRYQKLSGTSMAAPHATGLAALLWLYRSSLTPAQVKEILVGTSAPVAGLEDKVISGGQINAKRALDAVDNFVAPNPPVNAPRSVTFTDTNWRSGLVSGELKIFPAENESDVEYYKVYAMSSAGFPLAVFGQIAANKGSDEALVIPVYLPVPRFATVLVAVSGNAHGEMQPRLDGPGPQVKLVDFVEPFFSYGRRRRVFWFPHTWGKSVAATNHDKALSWGGDTDTRAGFVAGRLRLARADDEARVGAYRVHWRNRSSTPGPGGAPAAAAGRGPLLGSVAPAGFRRPTCASSACDFIDVSRLPDGGYRYSRRGGGADGGGAAGASFGPGDAKPEAALIALSGPARVTVRRFDVGPEACAALRIGAVEVSRRSRLPLQVDVPRGDAMIAWNSDGRVSGAGWSLDLLQEETVAELAVVSTRPAGDALEVVIDALAREGEAAAAEAAADAEAEAEDAGTIALVLDHDEQMPPSEAFAPRAVRLSQGPTAAAEVLAAPSGAASGAVTFYRVDLADNAGLALGDGWSRNVDKDSSPCLAAATASARVAATGRLRPLASEASDCWISVPIPAAALTPVAAAPARLRARAGNAFGLGAGEALSDLLGVSATEETEEAEEEEAPASRLRGGPRASTPSGTPWRQPQPRNRCDVALGHPGLRGDMLEDPWLRRWSWMANMGALASAASAAGGGAAAEAGEGGGGDDRVTAEAFAVNISMSSRAAAPAASIRAPATSGRVRGSVAIAGLDSVPADALRTAVEPALAAAIGDLEQRWVTVRVLRLDTKNDGAASAQAPIPDKPGPTVHVEFEVSPGGSTAPSPMLSYVDLETLLDVVEARLILLSLGGTAVEAFDLALSRRLPAAPPRRPASAFGDALRMPPRP